MLFIVKILIFYKNIVLLNGPIKKSKIRPMDIY
jgi:hypothetical protein